MAEDIPEWVEDQGKHVLYILLGNAAGKERQMDLAQDYFERAVNLEPDYARAYIGLGSVAYIRALEHFEQTNDPADIDNNLLDASIQNLQKALEVSNQPPLADIQTKVHFGLGQAYLARSYSGKEDRFDTAIEHFDVVILNYDDGKNPRIHELAAESHARLGLIYDLLKDPSQAGKEYAKAAELHLNYDPERSAIYSERAEKFRSITPNSQ
jgi:tetratricopeptide (TPR) repeat protein